MSARTGYWTGGALPRGVRTSVPFGWSPWRVAVWNMAHAPHLLVSGRTGSGKSTAVRTLLGALPALVVPWRVVIIDPKGGADWFAFGGVAHIARTSTSIVEAFAWLSSLLDDHARLLYSSGARSWTHYVGNDTHLLPLWPTVVVVDEAVDVFGGLGLPRADAAVVVDTLGRVVRQGRALGMHAVLSVLRPDATALGSQGGLLREQLGGRIALGPLTDESRRMLRLDDTPRHARAGRGFGVVVGTEPRTEFDAAAVRVAYLDDDQVVEQLRTVTAAALTGPPLPASLPVDP